MHIYLFIIYIYPYQWEQSIYSPYILSKYTYKYKFQSIIYDLNI